MMSVCCCVFFSSRRRHTRLQGDWSSDVCSSDLKRLNERIHKNTWAKEIRNLASGTMRGPEFTDPDEQGDDFAQGMAELLERSEERRVGKECRSRWSPYH